MGGQLLGPDEVVEGGAHAGPAGRAHQVLVLEVARGHPATPRPRVAVTHERYQLLLHRVTAPAVIQLMAAVVDGVALSAAAAVALVVAGPLGVVADRVGLRRADAVATLG